MRARRRTIGWFGADVVDFVGGAASSVGDAISDLGSKVPLAPELAGALKDLVNGPLRDFARSPVGLVVFRAMSTTLYGPLAWTVLGPQVAALAFALPGLARGESFWNAWLTELNWRAQKTAEVLAPSVAGALTPKIQEAANALLEMAPSEVRSLALSELAKRLHVDEWTAAMAGWLVSLLPKPERGDFDPVSGAKKNVEPSRGYGRVAGGTKPGDPCVAYRDAILGGAPKSVADALYRKCAEQTRAQNARAPAIASSGGASTSSEVAPKRSHDVMLAIAIVAAVGAVVYWNHAEGKSR